MLNQTNQAALDAIYSATYVENYIDCVENLPDDIQRYLTRMHELDVNYRGFLKDLDVFKESLERDDLEIGAQRKTLYKMEQVLISLQEVGDEKVEIVQHINDLIDNKYRQLDQDLRNLDFYKEAESSEQPKETSRDTVQNTGSGSGTGSNNTNNNNNGNSAEKSNGTHGGNERTSKRSRRSRTEPENTEPVETRMTTTKNATSGNTNANSGNKTTATNSKKKKRKCRQREESPPKEEEVVHEIDEPTYCLCDQISYGEMIMCDNDLCPIEWFHFVCVSLVTKPKGKWFCPRCRGDRPNVMKPKSQFLKELERYNKEKEEKA
ncbi:inhibitor of growth protein 1 [Cimex lectularius]|uniref:Inhibitor of growth protein n=1 Tax=Cimex lectularius TaxID=79782 RepID=A0A8I6RRC6_CIMLE|nr:inhibitor of growth protein 1 [Cimex lectularius]